MTEKSPLLEVIVYILLKVISKFCTYLRMSTLAKELSAAASVMQSSSKELSTLVADRV